MTSSVRRQFYLALLDYSNAESMETMDSLGVKAIRMCVSRFNLYCQLHINRHTHTPHEYHFHSELFC